MIVIKGTAGVVYQKFDTETRKFLGQEFDAGDQVVYQELESGKDVKPFKEYLPFDMVQPKE